MLDVLEAFAREHLLSFGLRTLLRGPTLVVRLLAALLVPWTVLLAMAEGWHFPAEWFRWAWVGFDVVLAAALFRLAVRWSDRLSRIVVGAVAADAVVTLAEVVVWNLPRLRGAGDALRPETGPVCADQVAQRRVESIGENRQAPHAGVAP